MIKENDMADLQNITFSQSTRRNVNTIQVRFEYSTDNGRTWTPFVYSIPEDMFSILPDEREQIAIQLIFAIARGKGQLPEG